MMDHMNGMIWAMIAFGSYLVGVAVGLALLDKWIDRRKR